MYPLVGGSPGSPYSVTGTTSITTNAPNGNLTSTFSGSDPFGTNTVVLTGPGWAENMHQKQGNVGLADGSVQQFSRTRVQEAMRNSGDNDHAAPPSPSGSNRLQFP